MATRYHDIITTFPRRFDNEVRVSVSTAGSQPTVDMRLWWLPAEQGEFVPTRKGVTIRIEELPDLIAALRHIMERAHGEE